jgi:P27 family predicted phage terminase small subunit
MDPKTMKPVSLKPPAHLSKSTKVWWRSVIIDYALEPHHLRLLQAACEAWDRLQQARELLARDGLVVEGREGGMRPHPAAAIERDSRIAFARLVRELDLDTEPPSSARTAPPALRSNRRGAIV